MRSLILAALGLLLATSAWAGTYTVTTTPEQDAALAAVVKSGRVATKGAPAVQTPQQAVQGFVDRGLLPYVTQAQRAAACAKVTDPSQKRALGCPAK